MKCGPTFVVKQNNPRLTTSCILFWNERHSFPKSFTVSFSIFCFTSCKKLINNTHFLSQTRVHIIFLVEIMVLNLCFSGNSVPVFHWLFFGFRSDVSHPCLITEWWILFGFKNHHLYYCIGWEIEKHFQLVFICPNQAAFSALNMTRVSNNLNGLSQIHK